MILIRIIFSLVVAIGIPAILMAQGYPWMALAAAIGSITGIVIKERQNRAQ